MESDFVVRLVPLSGRNLPHRRPGVCGRLALPPAAQHEAMSQGGDAQGRPGHRRVRAVGRAWPANGFIGTWPINYLFYN